MAPIVRFGIPLLFACLVGCGGAHADDGFMDSKMPKGGEYAMGGDNAVVKVPVTSLRRSEVKATIAHGLGYFLQNVTVEDWPVMTQDGKFHGFTIKSINDAWGIDLKPGDVVTRVNGVVPEQPDDADVAFRSLEKATALKVDYERNGQPRTLELPITD